MARKAKVKRDLDRTRRLIVEAAAEEFARHGMAGARVDAIAKRAGVNKAMIYYIFGSKEGLHLTVLEELFEEKTEKLDSALPEGNVSKDDLFKMLSNYFDAFLGKRQYARIMLHDIADGGSTLQRLKEMRPDLFEHFSRISRMVSETAEKGAIRNIDPDKSVLAVVLLMTSLAAAMSHMDLLIDMQGATASALSDPDTWKMFLTDFLGRALG